MSNFRSVLVLVWLVFAMGCANVSSGPFPQTLGDYQYTPRYVSFHGETFEVVEDVAPTTGDFDFITFLKGKEEFIAGEEMRKRARSSDYQAYSGLSDAAYLLVHQSEIPVVLRDKYLVFAGALLRSSYDSLIVACLLWNGRDWALYPVSINDFMLGSRHAYLVHRK